MGLIGFAVRPEARAEELLAVSFVFTLRTLVNLTVEVCKCAEYGSCCSFW